MLFSLIGSRCLSVIGIAWNSREASKAASMIAGGTPCPAR